MPRVENDLTRDPRAAVIIAGPRAGSTFLAHCLSNHSDVYCERQEVMHVQSSYRRASIELTPRDILEIVFGQSGHVVAACKLQYSQALYPGAWDCIAEHKASIIHLVRGNKLRQAVSRIINRMARANEIDLHPQHSWRLTARPAVTIPPQSIMEEIESIATSVTEWREKIEQSGLKCLSLSYVDIVGDGLVEAKAMNPATSVRLCQFLAIRSMPLHCDLKRINPWPLSEIVTNWSEIVEFMKTTEYAILTKIDGEGHG